MITTKPRRRRRRDKIDPATLYNPGGSTPTGPAGGDLGGNYPDPSVNRLSHCTAGGDLSGSMDAPSVVGLSHATAGGDLSGIMSAPTVTNLSHATAGGDLSGTMDAPSVTNLSHVTAGGDLGGTMDAPEVHSIANVTTGPATYPAGSAAWLTNIPAPPTLQSGSWQLGADGTLNVGMANNPTCVVPSWQSVAAQGNITATNNGDGTWHFASSSGYVDAYQNFGWIAF